ncbi:MAG: four helix bundle protein [Bacteroidota bacterium]
MATLTSFEELESWKTARLLTQTVYNVSRCGDFARDFALRDQMRRASISVMSNIAEGFERGGTKEFINFLSIARGSAGEVRAQLYIALDQAYIDQATFDTLVQQTKEIARTISGLMNCLQRSNHRGLKYKT